MSSACSPKSDPVNSLGFLVNDVARLLRRNFIRRAHDLDLSPAQWRALAYLARQQGVNQVTLAESLEIQPMTVARLIDHLQHTGLVERRPDPGDRRAFRLYLTAEAQPLLARMKGLAARTRDEALADLSEAAARQLVESLDRMKQTLLACEQRAAAAAEAEAEAESNAVPDAASATEAGDV